jgi:hypothetical protein
MGKSKNAYGDVTRIGQEPHPWYCRAHNVYIGFEFVSDARWTLWPQQLPGCCT